MRAAIPILLAGLGGAALAVAVGELLGSLPRAGEYVASAVTALGRAGREGSAPSEIERRRLGVVAGAALGVLAWLLLGSASFALVAGLGPVAAGWAIDRRRRRYRMEVESQIPALASGLADALAAGASLRTGLRDLAGSIEGAAFIELRRVDADLSVGVPPRHALGALAERVGSEPVSSLVRAVLSQQRSGGDLAGLLRTHGQAAVQRQRAGAEARSASAQARLTGGMVAAMPLGVALLVEMVAPGFIGSMLAEPVAVGLVVLALALQACGYLLIQRLGRVRA